MKDYKKTDQNIHADENTAPAAIIQKVIDFLLFFMPKTLAKRLIAIVLLAADIPVPKVMELSGLSDRSVRGFRKSLMDGNVVSLFTIKNGTGSRSKMKGFEAEIIAEVEKNNYHTQQQIADMIKEKFGISVSTTAVARLLKKTASKS